MLSAGRQVFAATELRAGVASRGFHTTLGTQNIDGLSVGTGTAMGTGGRGSVNGITAVVFGATGFLGRYVVNNLGKDGTMCYLPFRGCENETRHLKVMADYGQLGFIPFGFRDRALVRKLIDHSDVVINLLGKHYDTKHIVGFGDSRINFAMEEVHVGAARIIAEECAMAGNKRLIHVSALGANEDSESRWARSKAKGEAAVKSVYRDAIIVRPSTLFGSQDRFLNWYATWLVQRPFTPLVNGGAAQLQPVYVNDVATVIKELAKMEYDDVKGRTVELAGPDQYTQKEVVEFVLDSIRRPSHNIQDLSPMQLQAFAMMAEIFPDPWLTQDQAKRMEETVVLDPASEAMQFADFPYVDVTSMESTAFNFLHRFRKGGHFLVTSGYHEDIKV